MTTQRIEAFRFPRIKARPSFDRRVNLNLYASNQMRAGACGSRRCCADKREHRDLESQNLVHGLILQR
ncbi:hypothetical protein GWE18_02755 [Bradyrhizobium sp. CSA112]|uniref:hypothetical protein n=1 Tax=Bradyrhizobium sp. CSA112 TaxID=2699170 RepID=UPI0023AF76DF|nr:hypothetical protein [Bradyrhizobium sp. CSA112]MDE5451796.1 hypothetical protein [Bradyrhizobium sp. CSA112]